MVFKMGDTNGSEMERAGSDGGCPPFFFYDPGPHISGWEPWPQDAATGNRTVISPPRDECRDIYVFEMVCPRGARLRPNDAGRPSDMLVRCKVEGFSGERYAFAVREEDCPRIGVPVGDAYVPETEFEARCGALGSAIAQYMLLGGCPQLSSSNPAGVRCELEIGFWDAYPMEQLPNVSGPPRCWTAVVLAICVPGRLIDELAWPMRSELVQVFDEPDDE